MRKIQRSYQLLAVCLVVALMVPVFVVRGYASDRTQYRFVFDEGTTQQSGQKDDVGTPSGGSAGVSILNADFALGNVRFYLLDAVGSRASATSPRYTTLRNYIPLAYNPGAYLYQNCYTTLVGIREGNTVYVSGNFQP